MPTLKVQLDDYVYTLPRASMMNNCDLMVVKANNNQAMSAYDGQERLFMPEGY